MTDDDLEEDIRRLIAIHHNRQNLGHTYWNANHTPAPKMAGDTARAKAYKKAWRARRKAKGGGG